MTAIDYSGELMEISQELDTFMSKLIDKSVHNGGVPMEVFMCLIAAKTQHLWEYTREVSGEDGQVLDLMYASMYNLTRPDGPNKTNVLFALTEMLERVKDGYDEEGAKLAGRALALMKQLDDKNLTDAEHGRITDELTQTLQRMQLQDYTPQGD